MTIDQEKEMKGYSSKCYFPEKRTLGLIASILAVENVVAPEGEIQKTANLGRATCGPWRYRGCSMDHNYKRRESHDKHLWSMEIQTPSLQVNWSTPHPVRRIDWL